MYDVVTFCYVRKIIVVVFCLRSELLLKIFKTTTKKGIDNLHKTRTDGELRKSQLLFGFEMGKKSMAKYFNC